MFNTHEHEDGARNNVSWKMDNDELMKLKRQSFLQEMHRRKIRENSEELRKLEKDLQRSYFCKALAQQIKEREEIIQENRRQEQLENDKVLQDLRKAEEILKAEANKERLKKDRFREDLRNQVVDSQKKKFLEYQTCLEEGHKQNAIIEKLAEEEKIKKKLALEDKQQTMQSLKDCIRQQEEWCKKQQSDQEIQDARIAEWNRQKEIIDNQRAEEKRAIEIRKSHISNLIGMKTLSIEEEKRKREEVLLDLLIEEKKAENDEAERKKLQQISLRQEKDRLDAIRYREEIVPLKLQEQKQLDRMFYEEEMRWLAERDKLEQLSDEKRRQKSREHRRCVLETLEERKRLREEKMKRDLLEHENILKEEKYRQQLIEEERIRLLQKHAPLLKGYIPHGVLRESDREFVPLPQRKPR